MMCIIVLLPDPDGPTIATNSPCATSSDTSRSALTRTRSIAYVRLIRSRLTIDGVTACISGIRAPTAKAAAAAGHDERPAATTSPGARPLGAARPGHDDVAGVQ